MRRRYRPIWLSDVHLGTGASRAGDLLAFLEDVSADKLTAPDDRQLNVKLLTARSAPIAAPASTSLG